MEEHIDDEQLTHLIRNLEVSFPVTLDNTDCEIEEISKRIHQRTSSETRSFTKRG